MSAGIGGRKPLARNALQGTGRRHDLLAILVLLAVPTIFLADVLFGGKVLLPVDDLFAAQPWRDFASQFGITAPHNHLIADGIVQNLGWKDFAKESVLHGELPLWNPYLFAGVPFLASGQDGVLYPLGVPFYFLPVPVAYGWFTLLHMFLGGLFMYIFLRVIAVPRLGAIVGALAFALSGFLVVSFIWPQILSTAIWLPLLLALIELSIRGLTGEPPGRPARVSAYVWPLLGAVVVALQFLAGHVEISFYVLFSAGFYAAGRLAINLWKTRRTRVALAALALLGMVGLGCGVAAVQIVPFAEEIRANFRAGFVTYNDVIGYALPKQRVISFLMPDFFGDPAVHDYLDVTDGQVKPAIHPDTHGQTVSYFADWDRKNYAEGASYVGILPLLCSALALLFRRNRYTWLFAVYGVWSLLLAFGTPLYRLFFYGIPDFDQLHTPFRWLFPYSLSVTVLAGIGAGWLGSTDGPASSRHFRWLAWVVTAGGALGSIVLVAALALQNRLLPLFQRVVAGSPRLQDSFGDGRAFFSFEWRNVGVFLAFLLASAMVMMLATRGAATEATKRHFVAKWRWVFWPGLLVAVLVADLFVFGYDFNTKADPAPLSFVPPAVKFLQRDPGLFRIVTYGDDDVLTPNTAMLFHLQDARGYETIIPRQYVDYWSQMEDPRGYLLYNKIPNLHDPRSLQSPLLDLLNVKYILTTQLLNVPGLTLAYQGEVNIYRNERVLPRAFVVDDPQGLYIAGGEAAADAALRGDFDPRRQLILEDPKAPRDWPSGGGDAAEATVVQYRPQDVVVSTRTASAGYLVLADSYFPGWEATIDGSPTTIYRADGNFRAVYLPPGGHRVEFRYRPLSFFAGLALSGVSLVLLLLGLLFFLRPRRLYIYKFA